MAARRSIPCPSATVGSCRRRFGRGFAAVLLAALIILLSETWTRSARVQARAKPVEDLVGIVIGKHEVATLLVLRRDGRAWLPIVEFAKLTRMKVDRAAGSAARTVTTPFGDTTFPQSAVHTYAGIAYVDSKYLIDTMNFAITPRPEQSALVVIVPWNRRSRADPEPPDYSDLKPDAIPPNYGIATVHGSLSYQASKQGGNVYDNIFRMTGFAGGGVWQIAYEDDLVRNRIIRDAIWMRQLSDNTLIQVGHQSIALHPLLSLQELTGVQYAWSSRPIIMSSTDFYPGALLSRHGQRQRTFAGRGPVGGWAELWFDGLLISRRDIKLDGTYAFNDIPFPSRQARVEIRIYDHLQPNTPTEVIRETIDLSELLLEAGQKTVLSGAGLRGNAFDVFGENTGYGGGIAGFAIARWGVSERLTLEAAVDANKDDQRAMAGVVAELWTGVVGGVSLASNHNGGFGYDAELSAKNGRWSAMLGSFKALRSASRRGAARSRSPIHTGHLGYTYSPTLEFGLFARHQRDEGIGYILPYVYWSPDDKSTLRIRPDRSGDYDLDAIYRMTPRDTFTLSADYEYASLTFTHYFEHGLRLSVRAGYDYDEKDPDLRLAFAASQLFGMELSWRVALYTTSELDIGGELSLRRKLWDGVYGYVDIANSHRRRNRVGTIFGDRDDLRMRFGLSFDLAYADGTFAKAAFGRVRPDVGNLAGVVAPSARGNDLSGIPIIVDGRYRTKTASDGSFFVAGVANGNHLVEIEEDSLPLEHVAKKRSLVAAVAPGAVTNLTFHTVVLYGAAGRVTTRGGDGVSGLQIAIVDGAGKLAGESETNAFGYYRVDNLPAGGYRVEVRDAGGKTIAKRTLSITNDHVFDVNLTVAANPKPAAR